MDSFAKFLDALAGFAWPILIFSACFWFRNDIKSVFQLVRQQVSAGAALKWKDFEFKGVGLSTFDTKGNSAYRQEPADKLISDERHKKYTLNKNLFLVHRVRPTGETHSVTNLPTFDISVYIIPHKNFGHINNITQVEYYFGHHFGLRTSEFGTKFVVENGSDGFAVKVNAYGPMLCEARIIFHDESESVVSRYLDFEGTDYIFKRGTNDLDQKKLLSRQEG